MLCRKWRKLNEMLLMPNWMHEMNEECTVLRGRSTEVLLFGSCIHEQIFLPWAKAADEWGMDGFEIGFRCEEGPVE
jgi:hypothetical protein